MNASDKAVLDKVDWNALIAYIKERAVSEFKAGAIVHRTDSVSWDTWSCKVVKVEPAEMKVLVEINRSEKGLEKYWQPLLSMRHGKHPRDKRSQ